MRGIENAEATKYSNSAYCADLGGFKQTIEQANTDSEN